MVVDLLEYKKNKCYDLGVKHGNTRNWKDFIKYTDAFEEVCRHQDFITNLKGNKNGNAKHS